MRFDLLDYPLHQAPSLRCRRFTVEEREHNFKLTSELQNKTAPLSNSTNDKNGNIGIGTAAPATEKLEVKGKIKADDLQLGSVPGAMPMPRNADLTVKSVTDDTVDIDARYLTLFDEATGFGKVLSTIDLTVNMSTAGANGLDTGAEVADRWYYLWVIYNGATTAGLLSASSSAPTLPAGYTFKKLVGAVRNKPDGKFLRFYQRNNSARSEPVYFLTDAYGGNESGYSPVTNVCPTAIASRIYLGYNHFHNASVAGDRQLYLGLSPVIFTILRSVSVVAMTGEITMNFNADGTIWRSIQVPVQTQYLELIANGWEFDGIIN
ncbi:MAG: hypothetical protein HY707_08930 [Ignavibacteriae bacterium]|nr:hypothetical protein [Ignavibacteriota bacterium]